MLFMISKTIYSLIKKILFSLLPKYCTCSILHLFDTYIKYIFQTIVFIVIIFYWQSKCKITMTIAAIVNKTVHPWLVFPAELLEPLVAAKQRIKYACLKYLIQDITGIFVYYISLWILWIPTLSNENLNRAAFF